MFIIASYNPHHSELICSQPAPNSALINRCTIWSRLKKLSRSKIFLKNDLDEPVDCNVVHILQMVRSIRSTSSCMTRAVFSMYARPCSGMAPIMWLYFPLNIPFWLYNECHSAIDHHSYRKMVFRLTLFLIETSWSWLHQKVGFLFLHVLLPFLFIDANSSRLMLVELFSLCAFDSRDNYELLLYWDLC